MKRIDRHKACQLHNGAANERAGSGTLGDLQWLLPPRFTFLRNLNATQRNKHLSNAAAASDRSTLPLQQGFRSTSPPPGSTTLLALSDYD